MNDLARIGYERRKLIDDLKRDIYNSRCKLEICGESNVFLRSICNSVSDSLVQEPQAPYIPNDSSKLLVGEYALMDKLQSINQVIERIESEKKLLRSACSQEETIIIRDGVEEIRYGQFENCHEAKAIWLPHSVRSIDCSAFSLLPNLCTVHLTSPIVVKLLPPVGRINPGLPSEVHFMVSKELIDKYRNSFSWKLYAQQIYCMEDTESSGR